MSEMYQWASELFPLNRSLTGAGFLQSLNYLAERSESLKIKEADTGTEAFDWTVPKEWTARAAYIKNSKGEIVVDFNDSNLHLMGYSTPVEGYFPLSDLQPHLFSLPDQPDAIPYVTSYYKENWGFCLSHHQREKLVDDLYYVYIDTELKAGKMYYGEALLPGEKTQEVLLSTYLCHPSMANNELSGPVVTTKLLDWLEGINRKYTYRVLFLPETIGSIFYLSQNLKSLQENTIAGWVITCVGDDSRYSFLPTKARDSYVDQVSRRAFQDLGLEYTEYSWLERGSDERQYGSPKVNLPIASIMRSKYGEYLEYHTSLDNLEFISSAGLEKSLLVYQKCIEILESDKFWISKHFCEPQMSKRSLYPTTSIKNSTLSVKNTMNVLSYLDGRTDLNQVASECGLTQVQCKGIIDSLRESDLIEETDYTI